MKAIIKQLKKRRHVVFLDLEGTQFSHEMIALGAVRVDLDRNYNIRKIYKGIKIYVKPKNPIGRFVEELTGINNKILNTQGVSYKEALEKLKHYLGLSYNKTCFITFGTHDIRIFVKSLEASSDADSQIVHHICGNYIDLAAIISQYIKDANGQQLSQSRYLELFGETPIGTMHDPLDDAKNLMLLYKCMMKNSDLIYESYLKVLTNMKYLPDPVHQTIVKLISGKDVTSEEFKKLVRNYIE